MPTGLEDASQDSIAAAAMRGDAMALQALWQEHRRWVAAVLLAYKPKHEDLEDLLQEVAMTLVSKISTIRDETNIRAWLRAVAINAARASARSGKSRPRLSLTSLESDQPGSSPRCFCTRSAQTEPDEESQRVVDLATQLPEAYREPLILKAVHGMRSRQISLILGIPEATVDTRVSRARKMLRELLHGPAEAGRARAASGGADSNLQFNGVLSETEHDT